MRKLFLSLALALGVVATANAQMLVGGRAALTENDFWGYDKYMEEAVEDFWGIGFNAGVAIQYPLSGSASVVSGLEFSMRRINNEIEGVELTIRMINLDIPVLLRYRLNPQLFAFAGPQISLNLSTNLNMSIGPLDSDVDIGDGVSTFEFAIVAGVGYTIMPKLDVDFRFVLGLTNEVDNANKIMGATNYSYGYDDEDDYDYDYDDYYFRSYAAYDDYYGYYDDDDYDYDYDDDDYSGSNADITLKHWQFQLGLTYWFM